LQFAIPKFPAEIKKRQDLLEAQMNALEARIDRQESMLKLVDAGIGATAGPSGAKSLHSTTLRSLGNTQQSGQSSLQRGIDTALSRLDLILESLRRAQGGRHDR
jgi:hypothetical protein